VPFHLLLPAVRLYVVIDHAGFGFLPRTLIVCDGWIKTLGPFVNEELFMEHSSPRRLEDDLYTLSTENMIQDRERSFAPRICHVMAKAPEK
jgi:hypothetical protein